MRFSDQFAKNRNARGIPTRYDRHKSGELKSGGDIGGERIFTHTRPTVIRSIASGSAPGAGTFFCLDCGAHLSLLEEDVLPDCPECGGSSFGRDSIFESLQGGGGRASRFRAARRSAAPDWLDAARERIPAGGCGLALREEEGELRVYPIERGWTRIGRSAAADIRLDDPSVSRRHALIVYERPTALRVLDDRSLNGVSLNGLSIDWARLTDGDELAIGKYRIFVLGS